MKFSVRQGVQKLLYEGLYNHIPAFGGERQNNSLYFHHDPLYRRSMHNMSLTAFHLFFQQHTGDLRRL